MSAPIMGAGPVDATAANPQGFAAEIPGFGHEEAPAVDPLAASLAQRSERAAEALIPNELFYGKAKPADPQREVRRIVVSPAVTFLIGRAAPGPGRVVGDWDKRALTRAMASLMVDAVAGHDACTEQRLTQAGFSREEIRDLNQPAAALASQQAGR